jgi:hypothetical protein
MHVFRPCDYPDSRSFFSGNEKQPADEQTTDQGEVQEYRIDETQRLSVMRQVPAPDNLETGFLK